MTYSKSKLKFKKVFLFFCVFCVLVLITGCAKKVDTNNTDQNQQQSQENQMPTWNENFDEASLSDLEIGQQISVSGTENSDNSISANQIMIGNDETDFENMGDRTMRPPAGNNSDGQSNNNQLQPPAGFNNGQRPDFQNMSDEERAKMREQMGAGGGTAGGGRVRSGNLSNGATRLVGEILYKDDTTITLKLTDGGSKLIFYSDETKVMKFKINSSELKEVED